MNNLRLLSINMINVPADQKTQQLPTTILNLLDTEDFNLVILQELNPVLIDSISRSLKEKPLLYFTKGINSIIISKFKIIQTEVFESSGVKNKARVLVSKICLNDEETLIASISIDFSFFNLDSEYEELRQVILKIDPDKDLPFVLSGNFYDWNQSAFTKYEELLKLKDSFKELNGEYARNFPASAPVFCLDRIYMRHFSVSFCDLYYNLDIETTHLPLVTQLRPKFFGHIASPVLNHASPN